MSLLIEKFLLFLGRLFCFGVLFAAIFSFCRALIAGTSIVSVLGTFFYISLPLATVGGLLFFRLFICYWVDDAVEGILWSRARLKKTPLSLSSFYGSLNNGAYHELWQTMGNLPEKEFRDPEVVLLYAQACMNLPEHAEEGVAAMERFFRKVRGAAGHSSDVLTLLLYYADTALAFRSPAEVAAVFEKALKVHRFSENEKKAVQTRLSVLKERMKTCISQNS